VFLDYRSLSGCRVALGAPLQPRGHPRPRRRPPRARSPAAAGRSLRLPHGVDDEDVLVRCLPDRGRSAARALRPPHAEPRRPPGARRLVDGYARSCGRPSPAGHAGTAGAGAGQRLDVLEGARSDGARGDPDLLPASAFVPSPRPRGPAGLRGGADGFRVPVGPRRDVDRRARRLLPCAERRTVDGRLRSDRDAAAAARDPRHAGERRRSSSTSNEVSGSHRSSPRPRTTARSRAD
jgi:hypothetical protein